MINYSPLYRWVDENLDPHEDFMGLYSVPRTDAKTLVTFIKDVLVRLDLRIEDCRGQCYDGAAVMSGARGGVAQAIMQVGD